MIWCFIVGVLALVGTFIPVAAISWLSAATYNFFAGDGFQAGGDDAIVALGILAVIGMCLFAITVLGCSILGK